MNEPEEEKEKGREQDFSEFAKHSRPPPEEKYGDVARAFMRGCGIVAGVVALIFFFVVGACFIGLSRW